MSKTSLSLVNVSVRLGGRQILSNVTAEVGPGEFVGVFGPNGAGKSTLANCILGLLPLFGGRISIFGAPVKRGNRLIGYMPQAVSASLEGTALSAFSVVAAVAEGTQWGMPSPWPGSKLVLENEVAKSLELAGASHYADRPFSILSGGEKQRIALAQALLGSPRLLILDEPLTNLDPYHQMRLVQCVQQIRASTGATVLFITHDINPLLGVMNRVLYVAGGSAALGTIDSVLTSEALSALYRTEMHVIRAEGRIFIVAAEGNVTETARHA